MVRNHSSIKFLKASQDDYYFHLSGAISDWATDLCYFNFTNYTNHTLCNAKQFGNVHYYSDR